MIFVSSYHKYDDHRFIGFINLLRASLANSAIYSIWFV